MKRIITFIKKEVVQDFARIPEGPGLSDEAAGLADYRVMIPMTHGVDSLNVASASAVAFWAMCR